MEKDYIENGFIILSRKIINSKLWQLPKKDIIMAITCLLYSNHQENKWFTGTKHIIIPRGSFITSLEHLQQILPKKPKKYTIQNIRTCINHLEKLHFLTKQSTKTYSLITIENYDKYQNASNYLTRKVTKSQQRANKELTTNKNEKNEKNVKNKGLKEIYKEKKLKHLDFVLLTEKEYLALIDSFGENKTKEWIERLNDYLGSTGKKYTSHYFTILSWNRKDNKAEMTRAEKRNIEGEKEFIEKHKKEIYQQLQEEKE